MANPNLINISSIYGNTAFSTVGTSTANVVANPTGSNSLYKINGLLISNYATNSYTISVQINSSGSNTYVISNAVVPANATLTVLGRDNMIYLTENTSIQAVSNFATAMQAICSHEILS